MNTRPSSPHNPSGSSEELSGAIAEGATKNLCLAAQPRFAREFLPGRAEEHPLTGAKVEEAFEGTYDF